jgi:hypothetical protein
MATAVMAPECCVNSYTNLQEKESSLGHGSDVDTQHGVR